MEISTRLSVDWLAWGPYHINWKCLLAPSLNPVGVAAHAQKERSLTNTV